MVYVELQTFKGYSTIIVGVYTFEDLLNQRRSIFEGCEYD